MSSSPRAVAALLLGCAAFAAADASASSEAECRKLGFAPSLLCSNCKKLGDFVGAEDALVGECQGCCTEDETATASSFQRAVLDVCK